MQAFVGCVSLRRVTIPASVKVMGKAAFGACVKLEELMVPEGVTEIQEQAFQGCILLAVLLIIWNIFMTITCIVICVNRNDLTTM